MTRETSSPKNSTLSAMLLVAGTCIGGGMLVLPLGTGVSGFIPSLTMLIICWIFMTTTGLFLIEGSLWMQEDAHFNSMASRMLGPIGKGISWILYLFICYASLVAYTAGGGVQVAEASTVFFGIPLSKEIGSFIFLFAFGAVIYCGSKIVGKVNAILFGAAVLAYFALVLRGIPEVNPSFLLHTGWKNSVIALPLTLTSFSFQTMAPSLTSILNRDLKALKTAIIGGTTIALVVYAIWQFLILGIVPVEGPEGLAAALAQGDQPATQFLREHIGSKWICTVAEFFAFFAIATSFLGMALGLFDFLSDGLQIKKEGWGKVTLGLLIVIPTLFFAIKFERIFLIALDTSGGIGDSILNGIIPVLIIWVGRYRMNLPHYLRIPGGRLTLIVIILFYLTSFSVEILSQKGIISSIYDPYSILEVHNVIELMNDS